MTDGRADHGMGENGHAMERRQADTERVQRARAGDEAAFGELYDAWFDRVYDLAFRILRDPNATADVAQDTFLTAWRGLADLRDPDAFGGWIRRIARNAALNRRKRDQRARPVDSEAMAVIEAAGPSGASAPAGFRVEDRVGTVHDPARIAEDAELAELVWSAAGALGERDAGIVDLLVRHDLAPAEMAEVMGINRNHANQLAHRARARLRDAIRARVLWRGGDPECEELAAVLTTANVTQFGSDAVRVITAHADECEQCAERRRLRLAPATLFGATPFLIAPDAVREGIADALAGEGVPMQGSTRSANARRRRSRMRRGLVAAAIAAVVLLSAVVTAVAMTGGDETTAPAPPAPVTTEVATTTSTTTTTTVVAAPPPPASEETLPTSPAQGTAPTTSPPIAAPSPPPPPSPPVTYNAQITMTPSSAAEPYFAGATEPTLQWSTSGGAVVAVQGPGFSSGALSGASPRICPNQPAGSWSVCTAAPGVYTYTLTLYDGLGTPVLVRTATLTIT